MTGKDQPHSTIRIPLEASKAEVAEEQFAPIGQVHLSILAFVVGVVTGFGAVGFRDLIGIIHNGLFLGKFAIRYDANIFTPLSSWGAGVILVPVLGAIV